MLEQPFESVTVTEVRVAAAVILTAALATVAVREVKAALGGVNVRILFPECELTACEEIGGFRLSGRKRREISSAE